MADVLRQRTCVPCEGGVPSLSPERVRELLKEVPGWEAGPACMKITRIWKFKDFRAAMMFVNRAAEIAEEEQHHPDVHIFYNRVTLELWTHAIGGLSENDFIVAAKINAMPGSD